MRENATEDGLCPNCEEPLEGGVLQMCAICRTLFCHRCTVKGYGREFCSDICRAMFFFGDADDVDEFAKEE